MITVNIEDRSGVKTIQEFYNQLKRAFETDEEISLDFSNVQRVDLSVLQVLKSAGMKARRDNVKITYKSVNKNLKNLFRIYGMVR